MSDETIMPFDFPAENPTIIKVILRICDNRRSGLA